MDADDVGLRQQVRDCRPLEILPMRLVRLGPSRTKDIHPEGSRHVCYFVSDVTKSDNSHCFSGQFDKRMLPITPVYGGSPFSGAYRIAVPLYMVAQFQ